MTGKVSQQQRILDHVRKTGQQDPGQICDALGLSCGSASVAVTLSRLRSEGLIPRKAQSGVPIYLPVEVCALLSREALARDCLPGVLASTLLHLVLRDDMVDAILDGVKP
jgi:hypothetical protein